MLPYKSAAENDADESTWSESYSDVVSLLLVFFIVLTSISKINSQKFEAVSQEFRNEFSKEYRLKQSQSIELDKRKADAKAQKKKKTKTKKTSTPTKKLDGEREVLYSSPVGFLRGTATLKKGARKSIQEAALLIKQKYNSRNVEIHCSSGPLEHREGGYRSAWDLSAARAIKIVRLLKEFKINEERMAFYGRAAQISENEKPQSIVISVVP